MMYSDSSPVFPVAHVAHAGDVSASIYRAVVGNHKQEATSHGAAESTQRECTYMC